MVLRGRQAGLPRQLRHRLRADLRYLLGQPVPERRRLHQPAGRRGVQMRLRVALRRSHLRDVLRAGAGMRESLAAFATLCIQACLTRARVQCEDDPAFVATSYGNIRTCADMSRNTDPRYCDNYADDSTGRTAADDHGASHDGRNKHQAGGPHAAEQELLRIFPESGGGNWGKFKPRVPPGCNNGRTAARRRVLC